MEEAIKRAARDLADSKYAIALTGAGMSTESGIPDFRGPSGVWTKNPERERKAYKSYEKFLEDPKEYWKERLTTPSVLGNLEASQPNKGHYALAELETLGILKCVVTQNVEVNAEPTPLTQEGVSDYILQGNTGEILPKIVEEIKK